MSSFQPLARIISVCSKKDIEAWSVACQSIVRYIDAKEYLIVVPDQEVDLFSSLTCEPYKVIPESFYVGELKSRLKNLLPIENHDRIGWYLQQFIKIAAAKELSLGEDPDQVVLIWDADTVPLKALRFVDETGKVCYYSGTENHTPYFAFIKRAFPWAKLQTFSFIAQCFPAKISWAHDFCSELESEGRDWTESIIANLDQSQRAGFSEYESLGTYIWSKYPDQVMLNSHPWERNGRSLLGDPSQLSNLELRGLAHYFDYISFEAWDIRKGIRASFRALRNRLKFAYVGLLHGANGK